MHHLAMILTILPECYKVEALQVLYQGILCSSVKIDLNASVESLKTLSSASEFDLMKERRTLFTTNLFKMLDSERNV